MKEIGLYVHIPFCRSKCLYCDFNSYEGREKDAEEYMEALHRELELYRKEYGFKFKTVFIGGGTPTVINCILLGKLMEKLAPDINAGAEVSMEANPGTVTLDSLRYYKGIGINRLSIGLQAWQQELLRGIGRIHGREDFLKAYEWARRAGFDNINADLMFALPNQTMDMWKETLDNVCRLGVDHVSCYSLKLEENTKLYHMHEEGRVRLPGEELDREMYALAVDMLSAYGYRRYEISNFSRKGTECRHNLIYWRNEEYLGIGAGSHSKLGNRRFWNHRDIDRYVNLAGQGKLPVEDFEELSLEEDMWETIFLALRLDEGLDIGGFEKKYNIDFITRYNKALVKLEAQGLIRQESGKLKLTDKGIDLSNSVFIEFL